MKMRNRQMKKRKQRRLVLNCMCGAQYCMERPKGDFLYTCEVCGRFLIQVQNGALDLKGVNVAPYIERKGGAV